MNDCPVNNESVPQTLGVFFHLYGPYCSHTLLDAVIMPDIVSNTIALGLNSMISY